MFGDNDYDLFSNHYIQLKFNKPNYLYSASKSTISYQTLCWETVLAKNPKISHENSQLGIIKYSGVINGEPESASAPLRIKKSKREKEDVNV